ncbi:MAG TPA: hypothetical protein VHY91_08915 [Pirellulales bacterium]|jgi:hypothetical protein|nr:hypothetical protein [Pirellulales bacterium]
MLTRRIGFLPLLFSTCAAVHAQGVPKAIEPYPLPAPAAKALVELAGESDVLILGEMHGSREVPAVAAALLGPLSKLGYGALALEVPAEQQGPLTDWATGKSETVPSFFAKPIADGRGNVQTLSLIRTALSAPLRWKLICFDESKAETDCANAKLRKMDPRGMLPPFADEFVAVCVSRDTTMATNLARQRLLLAPEAKVLAICGNFHAQTANHSAAESKLDISVDDSLNKFWPSFAAALQNVHPTWRVKSVNVVPHGGGYFASVSTDDGGPGSSGVQTVHSTRHFPQAEAQRLDDDRWNWELNLPRVTPVTFLAEPTTWAASTAASTASATSASATVPAPSAAPPSASPSSAPMASSPMASSPPPSASPSSASAPVAAAPNVLPLSTAAPTALTPSQPASSAQPAATPAAKPAPPPPTRPGRFRGLRPRLFRSR